MQTSSLPRLLIQFPFTSPLSESGNRQFHDVYLFFFLTLILFCSFSSLPQSFTGYSPALIYMKQCQLYL